MNHQSETQASSAANSKSAPVWQNPAPLQKTHNFTGHRTCTSGPRWSVLVIASSSQMLMIMFWGIWKLVRMIFQAPKERCNQSDRREYPIPEQWGSLWRVPPWRYREGKKSNQHGYDILFVDLFQFWVFYCIIYFFYSKSCILSVTQTFISEELNHPGALQPTPSSIWGALLIELLVCSCSCDFDFDAGNFQLSSLLRF